MREFGRPGGGTSALGPVAVQVAELSMSGAEDLGARLNRVEGVDAYR
jgi:hypothetical protein